MCYTPVVQKHIRGDVTKANRWIVFHVVVHAGQLKYRTHRDCVVSQVAVYVFVHLLLLFQTVCGM